MFRRSILNITVASASDYIHIVFDVTGDDTFRPQVLSESLTQKYWNLRKKNETIFWRMLLDAEATSDLISAKIGA